MTLSATLPIALYGPGDVVRIDADDPTSQHLAQIVRTEPEEGTANFEPDYLAGVELKAPDLAWLFTPAGASGNRLQPWLVLIVLARGEFDQPGDKLSPVTVHDVSTLPDLSESWAWAHAQVAFDPTDATLDMATMLQTHPEAVICRLLCPRHLSADTAYTAFLVPAFDAGVQTGLGQTPSSATLNPAWTSASTVPFTLPVYFQFSFHTSSQGDFESLVRRMQVRMLPPEVGLRPMDVAHLDLGWGVHQPSASPLGMGGALRSVTTVDTAWLDNAQFIDDLATLLNQTGPPPGGPASPGPDPTVVPPLYGRWLAAQSRVPTEGWVQDLNLDPRRRGAAGLGTQVVLMERSELMVSAWKQLAGIQKANQLLRQAQLARSVLVQILEKHFQPAVPEMFLALTAPIHARVQASTNTVRATLAASRLPLLALSAAFRRFVRPFGPLRRRQGAGSVSPYAIVARLNSGEISAAPPPAPPGGMQSIDQTSDGLYPTWAPRWLWPLLPHAPWLVLAIAALVALLLLIGGWLGGWIPLAIALAVAVLAAGIALAVRLRTMAVTATVAGVMRFDKLTPSTYASVPQQPSFTIVPPGHYPATPVPATGADSPDASAFRTEAGVVASALQSPAPDPPPAPPANLDTLREATLARLDPNMTVAARFRALVQVAPSLGWTGAGDPLAPIMAAPNFPQPMLAPLRDRSQDWLLPNLKDVPPDTMALLKVDHAFIEAYMVGLNQEMARLLLWNHYPTDQRGTYFRQFWDVSSYVPPTGSAALQEKLYDIPPITKWPLEKPLGQNDNRSLASDNLVLLLRGELLRRYPNAMIYACPAIERQSKNEPRLVLDPAGPELHPLFRGTLPPDITFFMFALSKERAVSDPSNHRWGWFFVFQQLPGEPRFGLEPSAPKDASNNWQPVTQWAQLSWMNFGNGAGQAPRFASPNATPYNLDPNGSLGTTPVSSRTILVVPNINPQDSKNDWGTDAAQIAYITMRLPARVAVHANTLLRPLPVTP
jgi:hypothetical protein